MILTGWYQVRQTQARQSKSGGAPANAQMQAVTKIMPIFFGVISYGFSAATTIYFVVSNTWRIGQQHFVLNKMYEEEHGGAKAKGGGTTAVLEAGECISARRTGLGQRIESRLSQCGPPQEEEAEALTTWTGSK